MNEDPRCTRPLSSVSTCDQRRADHDPQAPHGYGSICEGYQALYPCASAECKAAGESDQLLHLVAEPHPRMEVGCPGYEAPPEKPSGGGGFGGGGASGGW